MMVITNTALTFAAVVGLGAIPPGAELGRLELDLDGDARNEVVILRASEPTSTFERIEIWREENAGTPTYVSPWKETADYALHQARGFISRCRIGGRNFLCYDWMEIGLGTGQEGCREHLYLSPRRTPSGRL